MANPLTPAESDGKRSGLSHRPAGAADVPGPASTAGGDSVDFDHCEDNGVLPTPLESVASAAPRGDDVQSLLERYHAEQYSTVNRRNLGRRLRNSSQGLANGVSTAAQDARAFADGLASTGHGAAGSTHLPPLVGGSGSELDRLRHENAELHAVVAELRQVLEANDPQVWEQLHQEQQRLLTERDDELKALRQYCEEWNLKMETHRLVPADDDLAKMSDELDKERCQNTQERRQLDEEKRQLKEDEESLMKQMREMEVSMARDRAELARQRTELQRVQNEVNHELELLQRGDASVKERLAQFQRRQDNGTRGSALLPIQQPAAGAAPGKPKDSTVFKRLFGQG